MARILVIDDSKLARQTCRQILAEMGHESLEATSGQEGLAAAKRHLPDAIVLDLLMHEMDGREVLKVLRQQNSSTPVIVMTADMQTKTRDECLRLGAIEVINKFVDPDDLKNAVEVALGTEK